MDSRYLQSEPGLVPAEGAQPGDCTYDNLCELAYETARVDRKRLRKIIAMTLSGDGKMGQVRADCETVRWAEEMRLESDELWELSRYEIIDQIWRACEEVEF